MTDLNPTGAPGTPATSNIGAGMGAETGADSAAHAAVDAGANAGVDANVGVDAGAAVDDGALGELDSNRSPSTAGRRSPLTLWNQFWFAGQDSSVLALWRTALGFTAFCWMASLSWDLIDFYGEDGLRPRPTYHPWRIGFFRWFESNTVIYLMYAMVLVTSLLVMIGRWLKLAAPLLFYGLLSFGIDNFSVLNGGDSLIRVWPFFFALMVLFTPGRLTGVPLFGRLSEAGERWYPKAPRWMLRLVQIQISVIYPASAIGKLPGPTWQEGTAALYAMRVTDFQRFPMPDFIENNAILGMAMTWYTLGLELVLSIFLWYPRTRRFAIFAGITMHLAFGLIMRLGFFTPVMAIGYIAFLKPSEARRIISWIGRLNPFHRFERPLPIGTTGADLVGPESVEPDLADQPTGDAPMLGGPTLDPGLAGAG